ncbi:MAG: thioredoxin [Chloroflexi bacterium]|jgi:thioredoxin 1|nr:thioredoxin [Chloroflexota bacterium]
MGEKTFEVTEQNFQAEVLESSQPVLIDFWAEWCGPCKMIAPIVAELADDYEGKLRVGKLDADAHQSILQQYGIMAIPTLMLFKGGEPVVRIQGFRPKGQIVSDIEPHLS